MSFDAAEIDKERGVVIEEWRLRRGAGARMFDKQLPVLLKGSRYAERLPIGNVEIIRLLQARPAEEVLHRLVPARADGGRRRRRLRQGGDRGAHQDALRHDPGVAGDQARARPTTSPIIRARSTRSPPTRKRRRRASPSTASCRSATRRRSARTASRWSNGCSAACCRRASRSSRRSRTRRFSAPAPAAGSFVRTKEVSTLSARVKDDGIERGLEALFVEAERVARFGFTATELDRQKRNILRGFERAVAEKDNTAVGRPRRRVRAQLHRSARRSRASSTKRRSTSGSCRRSRSPRSTRWRRTGSPTRNRVVVVSAPQKDRRDDSRREGAGRA